MTYDLIPTELSKVIPKALLLLISLSALAAEESNQISSTIETIEITAEKRVSSIQEVPMSLNAFSSDMLKASGIEGTKQLQNAVPGLVFNNTGTKAQPYIRGVGSRLPQNGLESSVAVYIDNRYSSRTSTGLFDFVDVERVEVLKGPQGTLYGRNATGGAIKVITKSPSDVPELSLNLSLGNYQARTVSGSVAGPITGNLAGRFSFVDSERDGFVKNIIADGVQEWDDKNVSAWRSKLAWQPVDWIDTLFTVSYFRKHDTENLDQVDLSPPGWNLGTSLGGISGTHRDQIATTIDDKTNSKEISAEFKIDASLAIGHFQAISTFADLKSTGVLDADGTSIPTLDVDNVFDNSKEYSQEFQLLSNLDSQWQWLYGVYFFKSNVDYELELNLNRNAVFSAGLQNMKTTAGAIFTQHKFSWGEGWGLVLGGRWSEEQKEGQVTDSLTADITYTAGLPYRDKKSWHRFTPKVVLEYQSEQTLYYLNYAQGFKSGGFNYPLANVPVLAPEVLDMIEFGTKGDYFDKRLRFNTSLYYYDYQDLQVTRTANNSNIVTTENAADAQIKGLDIDITWHQSNQLTFNLSLNFLDSEYKDYQASAQVFNAVLNQDESAAGMSATSFDASGQPLLRAADWSAYVSLSYDVELPTGQLPVTLGYAYKDDYLFDFIADKTTEQLKQSSFGLLNARISYLPTNSRWHLALWANNLTNSKYFDDIVANSRGLRGSWGQPRTIGLEFSYDY